MLWGGYVDLLSALRIFQMGREEFGGDELVVGCLL